MPPPTPMTCGNLLAQVTSPAFLMPPPTIIHAERIPPQAVEAMSPAWSQSYFPARTVRLVEYEDVYLCADGLLLRDDLTPIESTIEQHPPADLAAAREAIERRRASGEPFPTLHGDLLLCRKPGAANYGHWMAELLPRYWLAARTLGTSPGVLVQNVPPPLRNVMRESLLQLGAKPPDILWTTRDPTFLPRVVCVEGLTDHGLYMSPLVLDCLDRLPRSPAAPGTRLLVLRGAARSRRFADEERLVQRLASIGFQPIDPSALALRDQAAAFAAAEVVVGAMGAALTNIAFCKPGTAVLMLSPAEMPDTFFWFLAGLKRLRLHDLRCYVGDGNPGPAPWDGPLLADAGMIAAACARIAAERELPPDPLEAARRLAAALDDEWYLSNNPDVAAAGMDPLAHYLHHGRREGRAPRRGARS